LTAKTDLGGPNFSAHADQWVPLLCGGVDTIVTAARTWPFICYTLFCVLVKQQRRLLNYLTLARFCMVVTTVPMGVLLTPT